MTSQMGVTMEMTSSVEEVEELWSVIVDWVQFAFTSAGFVANVLTLVTLYVNAKASLG